jgi:hypothetical protein
VRCSASYREQSKQRIVQNHEMETWLEKANCA